MSNSVTFANVSMENLVNNESIGFRYRGAHFYDIVLIIKS